MRRISIQSGCWRRKMGFQGPAQKSWHGDQTDLSSEQSVQACRVSMSDGSIIKLEACMNLTLTAAEVFEYALCLNILRKQHLHVTPVVLVLDIFCNSFFLTLSVSGPSYTSSLSIVIHTKYRRILYTLSVDWVLWAIISGRGLHR
jgi:hypothetical protein